MELDEEVRFFNNQGVMDDQICRFIEDKGDYCRIKKPSGEILRIFKERICSNSDELALLKSKKPKPKLVKKAQGKTTMDTNEEKFDPWSLASDTAQVWIKSNSFSDSVIAETIAIIEPDEPKYKSVNVYNGKATKVMQYTMKSLNNLINKLEKRGYKQADR